MAALAKLRAVVGERLLGSPWLRRLDRISFLGTLDFHPASRRSSSRLAHSLGVAELGLRVAGELGLDPALTRTFVAACLLHDIGHFPLSHAAEPGFERALGVDHHAVSEWIVRGNGAIDRGRSMRPDLEAAGIDPEVTWSLITGDAEDLALRPLAALLRAPINLDTLDGILRAAHAFRIRGLRLPERLFRGGRGAVRIDADALPLFDRFWALKDRVYGDVIALPSNVLCEAGLSAAVEGRFTPAVFAAFERFDDDSIAGLVRDQVAQSGLDRGVDDRFRFLPFARDGALLRRARKRYHVDRSVLPGPDGLALEIWPQRYRHERQVLTLVSTEPEAQLVLPGFEGSMARELTLAEGPEI
ncbi:MAG: HD domain-containing protein [Nannocystaceae bacterium]